MPKISFDFSGYAKKIEITKVYGPIEGEWQDIDVSSESTEQIVEKLNSGDYFLSFEDIMNSGSIFDGIEMINFEAVND